MSRNVSPWIMKALNELMGNSSGVIGFPTKVGQITGTVDNLRILVLSDSDVFIHVFLTQNCIDQILDELDGDFKRIDKTIVKIEKFHFSTALQNSGNRNSDLLKFYKISHPLALQVSKLTIIGSPDSTTIGEPVDVNRHPSMTRLWSQGQMEYKALVKKLLQRQFPDKPYLPDYSKILLCFHVVISLNASLYCYSYFCL